MNREVGKPISRCNIKVLYPFILYGKFCFVLFPFLISKQNNSIPLGNNSYVYIQWNNTDCRDPQTSFKINSLVKQQKCSIRQQYARIST